MAANVITHLPCGGDTTITIAEAEMLAKDPRYFARFRCSNCKWMRPVGSEGEFVWAGTDKKVGT